MKVIGIITTFLTVMIQAINSENAVSLLASVRENQANVPLTVTDISTSTTNSSDPTSIAMVAPTEKASLTSTPVSPNSEDPTPSTKPTGIIGVAYMTTRAEFEAEQKPRNDNGTIVPIVIIGCVVGVIGVIAAAVVMKKRKLAVTDEEKDKMDYSNAINTPVMNKTKKHARDDIITPNATDCMGGIKEYPL